LAANLKQVEVWDATTGEHLQTVKSLLEPAGFLPGTPWKLVLGGDTAVQCLSAGSKSPVRVLGLPKGNGYCWVHALSPDGQALISVSETGTVLKTDTATWKSAAASGMRSSCGFVFAFSPDSSRVAIVGSSGTVLIWDVVNHKPWLKWSRTNFHSVHSPCFSPDGQRLAVSLEGHVHILDFRVGAKSRAVEVAQPASGLLQCVTLHGAESQMDQAGCDTSLNPKPIKCQTCRMLDLDHVASPYKLGRGLEKPVDLAIAEAGNFLVRETARQILETVAPGQCRFVPTVHAKTGQPTPWFLAVPLHTQATATPPQKRERCPACGEPWCFHYQTESQPGENWSSPVAPHDLFKARQWGCHLQPFKGWDRDRPWIFPRLLYFSLRLELLLKRLKLRGLSRSGSCKELPSAADEAWVKERLARLAQTKTPASGSAKANSADAWFQQFLTQHAKNAPAVFDFNALEKREGCRLPQSYQDFSAKIGRKKFADFQGEEGLDVTIWPAAKLDFDTFRNPGGECDGPTRAVVFATLENGDSLCFDLSEKGEESAVFHYDHETDSFEPFAKTFADCIRQLVGANRAV
jgi:hypothetical protein